LGRGLRLRREPEGNNDCAKKEQSHGKKQQKNIHGERMFIRGGGKSGYRLILPGP